MESPLNLAHQQGRKADSLIKAGKFDEAIACHNRAAEFLLEAMQATRYTQALESLRLQHAHHLKQTDKLYDRHRRAQLLQIKTNRRQYCDKSSQTLLQGPVSQALSEHSMPNTSTPAPEISAVPSWEQSHPLEDSIYHTLTENDSLIGMLLRRKQNMSAELLHPMHSGVPVERVVFSRGVADRRKENEDLKFHNEDLRKHVKSLMKELDGLQRENRKLKEKFVTRETIFSDVGQSELETIPDLPPLEMPTFDFNLTDDMENSDECDSFDIGKGKSTK